MATYSLILAWRIPWTEEPGRLWSTGSQKVGHELKQLSTSKDEEVLNAGIFVSSGGILINTNCS